MTVVAPPAVDIAQALFGGLTGVRRAVVEATQDGIAAGSALIDPALAPANAGGWSVRFRDGQPICAGDVLVELEGAAAELAVAEDYVLGPIGYASGIATRARMFRTSAPSGLSIACGGWKKLPAPLKPLLRAGLAAADLLPRLVEGDFVYMSKNAVLLLGGVEPAIRAGVAAGHGPVAVQVQSVDEALVAVRAGAGVIVVDTGRLSDLADVQQALTRKGLRDRVTLAFGGGVALEDLGPAHATGAEAVDVGRAILDAPLLDLRMRVIA
jgi:nicotinate-nucleotide pyrophosphorylase (carboxylating)